MILFEDYTGKITDEENLYLDWVFEQEEIKRQIQFQEDMEYMDWALVNGTIVEY
jgi:hypothetical protein